MKKIILSLFLICLLAIPVLGLGATAPDIDVFTALSAIINWLFTFLMIAAVFSIVMAGYLFVTSSGNPSNIKKAQDIILWALIGIVVAFLAKGSVNLICHILGAEGTPGKCF